MWTTDDLERIGNAYELELAPSRTDGTPRPFVTMWVVRVGDDLFVRAGYGRTAVWFRHAQVLMEGRIRAAGLELDVLLDEPGHAVDAAVTAAYHAKYDGAGASNVSPMVAPAAAEATLRLRPRT